jgi:hypothetical protein
MSKALTIVALLIASGAYAQCDYSRNEVDEFTGRKITTTKFSKAKAKTGISAELYVSAGSVSNKEGATQTLTLALTPSTAVGCVSTSSSKAIFLWADGTTEEITHAGSIECGNPSHLMIVQEGSRLLTEQPTKVRLYFTKGYVDVELLDDSIIKAIGCLAQ